MLCICNMCIVYNSSVRVRKVFIVTLIREVLLLSRVSQVAHEYLICYAAVAACMHVTYAYFVSSF